MEQQTIELRTKGRGTWDITDRVRAFVDGALAGNASVNGLCHLFLQHTSASLILCENADPDVRRDLETFMAARVPDGDPMFSHIDEGPDDMPAHVRSILTQSDLNIPVRDGRCALGTWQGVYLWEHRDRPHRREVAFPAYRIQRIEGVVNARHPTPALDVDHPFALVLLVHERLVQSRRVEHGRVEQVLESPAHPYTRALLSAVPVPDPTYERPEVRIKGGITKSINPKPECRFRPRCPIAQEGKCDVDEPELTELEPGHWVACHFPEVVQVV